MISQDLPYTEIDLFSLRKITDMLGHVSATLYTDDSFRKPKAKGILIEDMLNGMSVRYYLSDQNVLWQRPTYTDNPIKHGNGLILYDDRFEGPNERRYRIVSNPIRSYDEDDSVCEVGTIHKAELAIMR